MKIKVLITCGPTWVPIDDVRVVSNVSSGKMGHLIAQEFVKNKCDVTMIQGPVTNNTDLKHVYIIKYQYFDELAKILKQECLKDYDIIVHAAAVSDFMIKKPFNGKLKSDEDINLSLGLAPKLINMIKRFSPDCFLVGFKLDSGVTKNNLEELTHKLFIDAKCDLVLANQQKPTYSGYILNADYEILNHSKKKEDIAQALVRTLL